MSYGICNAWCNYKIKILTHTNKRWQEQIHKDQKYLDTILNRKHKVGVSKYIECKWLLKIKLKSKYDHIWLKNTTCIFM